MKKQYIPLILAITLAISIVSIPIVQAVLPAPELNSPTNAAITADTTPTFTWSSVAGANKYYIMIDDSPTFFSPFVADETTSTSYTYSISLGNATYYWRVLAIDAGGIWGDWSEVRSVTVILRSYLSSPTNGSTTSDSTPTFEWLSRYGADSYRIQIDESSLFGSPVVNTTTSINTYTAPTLLDDTYYWRVRVIGDSAQTDWSDTWSFTVSTGDGPGPDEAYFTVEVSSTSGSVVAGNSVDVDVTVISVGGYSQTVTLSATGAPGNTSVDFSPLESTPSFNSIIAISTSSVTPTGQYTLTITGTGADAETDSTTYSLQVTSTETPTDGPGGGVSWEFPWWIILLIILLLIIAYIIYRYLRRKAEKAIEEREKKKKVKT